MTEGIEHALEYVLGGVLFCMAIVILLQLHGAFLKQIHMLGRTPEQLILFEQEGEEEWRH